jgi:hypothetical protein
MTTSASLMCTCAVHLAGGCLRFDLCCCHREPIAISSRTDCAGQAAPLAYPLHTPVRRRDDNENDTTRHSIRHDRARAARRTTVHNSELRFHTRPLAPHAPRPHPHTRNTAPQASHFVPTMKPDIFTRTMAAMTRLLPPLMPCDQLTKDASAPCGACTVQHGMNLRQVSPESAVILLAQVQSLSHIHRRI